MEQQGDVTNGGDGAEGANGGPAQPSKEKKTRRPRWSEPEQRTMLLAAIERRLILRGRFLGGSGANYKRRKAWEEVARKYIMALDYPFLPIYYAELSYKKQVMQYDVDPN